MFDLFKEYWMQCSFWDKIYVIYAAITLLTIIGFVVAHIGNHPKKKLNFITEAYKDGRMVVGKLTCLTVHGVNKPQYYQAEYMYVIDGKRYFVTYKMWYSIPIDSRMSAMNADMLLLKLKPALILFYDKKRHDKVMSKLEVFTSEEGIHQVYTSKKNIWRNTEIDWTEPIDLVQY